MNLTFLNKLGLDIVKVAGIVTGFEPLALAALPSAAGVISSVVGELQQMSSIVVGIEAVGASTTPVMTGVQKLQAATPQVAQVILKSSALVGHTVDNQALFTQGASSIASGIADVLNSLKAN